MESFDAAAIVEQLGTLVTTWGLRVLGAVAVLLVGRAIAKKIRSAVRAVLARREADPALAPFLSGIAYWLALVMVIIAVLGLFGIPTASFVAVIGAAGLAVGLALQGTLSNFAAGVMLLVFRPFEIGNFVETAGVSGSVREIGIFFTRLDTPDNVRVTVPNSEVFGKVIKNYQGNDTRRIDLVMGVGYDDDLSVARRTIADTVDAAEGVLEDPAPVIEVHELGDSSVNFVVRPWVRTEDYWSVRWKLMHDLKVALEGAGCSIPYPQRDVHLFEAGGSAA